MEIPTFIQYIYENPAPFIIPILYCYYCPHSEASEGYVFTGVCHSVIEPGGGRSEPETWSQHLPPSLPPGLGHNTPLLPDYAQAGGTHPTGMHSCLSKILQYILCTIFRQNGHTKRKKGNKRKEVVAKNASFTLLAI